MEKTSKKSETATQRQSRRRILKRACLGVAAAGAAYTAGTSQLLDVTRVPFTVNRLGEGLNGLKVAFAADFHMGPHFPLAKVKAAVKKLSSLQPDIILLGGDYVTRSSARLEEVFAVLKRLHAPLGVYAVPGNHDYWSGMSDFATVLEGSSIANITNRAVRIERGGSSLWIAGLDDLWGGSPDPDAALADVPADAPRIVMCHNPYTVHDLPAASADFVLAGHTHGWQVYVPLVTRFLVPGNMSKFRAGFYRTAAGVMYVTRGVGMIAPPIRLWCRPEIVLFELGTGGGTRARS